MTAIFQYAKSVGWLVILPFFFFLLDPFEIGYIGGYFLFVVIFTRKIILQGELDFDFFILTLFSIIYGLFYTFQPDYSTQQVLFYLLFPQTFFLLGKYFVMKTRKISQLYILFFTVGLVFSLTPLISVGLNLIEGGFVQVKRTLPVFWSGKLRTATLMAAYMSFNMCIPTLLLVRQRKFNLFYRIAAGAIFVGSLLVVFRLGSRTQVVICIMSILIGLFYIVPKQGIKKNIQLFMGMGIVALLIYLYIPISLDAEYFSVLGNRLQEKGGNTESAGGRTALWEMGLNNLFKYPFGWTGTRYAHNLWLDVAQVNGLMPFFALVIFTIRNIINTKKAVLRGKENLPFKSMILVYTLAANLLFFVEPVIQGVFYLFVVYCFYQGAISKFVWYNERGAFDDELSEISAQPKQS